MTYIELYLFSILANIVLCIPSLAISNADNGGEGLKDVTFRDIFSFIGLGLIPLWNTIQAFIMGAYVVGVAVVYICENVWNKKFWDVKPFNKNR